MSKIIGEAELLEHMYRVELAIRLRAVANQLEDGTINGVAVSWEGGTHKPKMSLLLKKPLEFIEVRFEVEGACDSK